MRNLFVGVCLAPYRLDYYNYIHEHMNFDIYFQIRNFEGQLFSTEELERKCCFVPKYLNVFHIGNNRWIVRGLKKLIEDARPEVVIVPEFSFLAMQVIAIKKMLGYKFKVISQCDDSYDMLVGGGFSKFHHSWARNVCVPLLDDLLLLDDKSARWYQERYHKGVFVPMIQDEAEMAQTWKNEAIGMASLLRQEYGLNGVKVLLFVGRLVEVKNLFRLMDACARLKFQYKLVIVGDGVLRKRLEEYSSAINVNVVFVGQKKEVDLTAWYYCADVFILPSTMEAFGAVTNEALLCGCNCCVSEVAGSACLIREGENGYLCNPQDVDDIADKITMTSSISADAGRQSKMKYRFAAVMDGMQKQIMK